MYLLNLKESLKRLAVICIISFDKFNGSVKMFINGLKYYAWINNITLKLILYQLVFHYREPN